MSVAENEHVATRIPVVREVRADLDTPLSVYLKLADKPNTYLFESVQGGERFGRYSIIGLQARRVFTVAGHRLYVIEDGELVQVETIEDPFATAEAIRSAYKVEPIAELPGFTGGLVGWFGFECVRHLEPRLHDTPAEDQLGTPEMLMMLSEDLAVFDNLKGKLYLITHADAHDPQARYAAQSRLDAWVETLRTAPTQYPPALSSGTVINENDFVSGFTHQGFLDAVAQIKDYIRAGDAFQVVLSQRLTVPFAARPVDLYRALRSLNPSPYMYFLNIGDMQVVGSSPEILVRQQGREVTVRPIAGTRPRGTTPEHDLQLEQELLADPKERAEHLMLIDLGRNDLGRICEPGSVQLKEQFAIERYSHVMHIVSEVSGTLREGLNYADVLRATFPAGTVSGAPKLRALEIIRELEPILRNVYAGCIGYIGWNGDADMAIAIRTAVVQEGKLHVQAGAGIVYDSDPESEWQETMSKSRALFRAVREAAAGL
ncbi:anthranilate synthase component I [Aquilutibacter rugosus]|uniref:anthranilate synthase component I n=1 Tax=Aquilutibacter rugosus TaxID=3115820 RepID=UPI003877EFB2